MDRDKVEIGVAVVGAGTLGRRHARAWAEMPGVGLRAVVDLDDGRARDVAGSYGVRWSTDVSTVFDDESVDAVSVASPDHLHCEPTIGAVTAGKHVFVEKPLATTLDDARTIVAAAERGGRLVHVNFSQRLLEPYAQIKRIIEAGDIGRPRFAVSVKRGVGDAPANMIGWAAQTSPIFFMSSHDLDLLRWYVGTEPVSVSARETRGVLEGRGVRTQDSVQALVEFGGGFSAVFSSGWIHPDTYPLVADDRLEIVGDSGVVEYRSRERILETHTATSAHRVTFTGPATATEVGGRLRGAFVESCRHFADAVMGRVVSSTPAADSLLAVACQAAILESARDGGRVLTVDGS